MVAAAAAAGAHGAANAASQGPARRGYIVPGIHGYTDEPAACAGQTVDFHISADDEFHLTIHRLGPVVDSPQDDPLVATAGPFPRRQQPIHPGSYVHIHRRIREPLHALTLEAWVRPWALTALQGVVTQEDKLDDRGFALGVGPGGYVGFFTGDGKLQDDATIHRTPPGVVAKGRWSHLVATWDGRNKRMYVDGREYGPWLYASLVDPGPHALRLGAMGENGETLRWLDGDIAAPAIYSRALPAREVRDRFEVAGLASPVKSGLIGYWPLDEERGEKVSDRSGAERDGHIINLGTWGVGGPSYDGGAPRYGPYNPAFDPRRGHALRLASDDLYDCEWEGVWRWKIPSATRSGLYAARFRTASGRDAAEITFVVRRPRRARPAPLLALTSMNTWRAYNAAPFGIWPASETPVVGTDGLPNPPCNPPAFSFYRGHAAGQGTFQLGWRLPCPVADSRVRYGGPSNYSHLLRAERFALGWLENSGFRFDVVPDHDVDREPELLDGRACVLLNGHSEYWSIRMLDALEGHLKRGGGLVVLSGNSLFWRVSFRNGGRVMECRKVDAPGNQIPPERRGEAWHSDDGMRGGMLRECGRPGWKLIGLDSLGWNQHPDPAAFGPYRIIDAGHPLFMAPEATSVREGGLLGVAANGRTTLANGHEIDVRAETLRGLQTLPDPAGSTPMPPLAGMITLARGEINWTRGGASFDYYFRPVPAGKTGGDMIYWERPDGGRVFNAGSIGSGWALAHDPSFQILIRNVLHRFGVKPG
jgi:Concanavalin A-like lectin/glucanases superfamily